MPDVRTGGCLCGSSRYEVNLDNSRCGTCHCRDCQKHSAAPFAICTTIDTGQFRWISAPKGEARASSRAIRRFCKDCGSPLTWESPEYPDEVSINTATLDDTSGQVPSYELFVRSRMPGVQPFQGARQYEDGGTS